MNTSGDRPVFASTQRFDEQRIRAAAIYCSDGRFGEQCDDFLHNALQLPRYDRLALPGGAACLAGHFVNFWEEAMLVEQLRFLLDVHGIERAIVIAHQDCAYYARRLRVDPRELEPQQRADLTAAVQRIGALAHPLRVEAYFARIKSDGRVSFEAVQ